MIGAKRPIRKVKVATDENSSKATGTVAGVKAALTSAARSALGDVSNNRKPLASKLGKEKASTSAPEKPTVAAHRRTVSNVSQPSARPAASSSRLSIGARPPVRAGPSRSISSILSGSSKNSNGAPVRPLPARARTMVDVSQASSSKPVQPKKTEAMEVEEVIEVDGDDTDIEEVAVMEVIDEEESESNTVQIRPSSPSPDPQADLILEEDDEDDWTILTPSSHAVACAKIEEVRSTFKDDVDEFDVTMVAEYADEIFAYMGKLEEQCMPSPDYMDGQTEIRWEMRKTLVDWLLQVHLRYHMLPETLWIAVNIVDRFLSRRVVSLVKLQLVGVTAMFIASKYEEIMAPSVDEFVYMTENGYTREEILKGEKIILQTLEFNVSAYCSPYSWVRRISKADDYDIQTRTLCKFLMEVTLLDHRFLRARPSLIAAIGMYTSKKMLQGEWDDAFVFYSEYTEQQLKAGFDFLIEGLAAGDFEASFVSKKYAHKKFLKASLFAREWAISHLMKENGQRTST